MIVTLKEITQKIIDLLAADQQLGIPAGSFYFGPPLVRNTALFCYVSWVGGPVKQVSADTEQLEQSWHIVIVQFAKADGVAAVNVMEKIERAREVLRLNRTLGGLVVDSYTTALDGEVMTAETDVLGAARLVLTAFIRKQST
jgi:hypothetical protein